MKIDDFSYVKKNQQIGNSRKPR